MLQRFGLALLATSALFASHAIAADHGLVISREENQQVITGGNLQVSEPVESYGGNKPSPEPSYGAGRKLEDEAQDQEQVQQQVQQQPVQQAQTRPTPQLPEGWSSPSDVTVGGGTLSAGGSGFTGNNAGAVDIVQALKPILGNGGYANSAGGVSVPQGWNAPDSVAAGGNGGALGANGVNIMRSLQPMANSVVVGNGGYPAQLGNARVGYGQQGFPAIPAGGIINSLSNGSAAGLGADGDVNASARERAMYGAFLGALLQYVANQPDVSPLSNSQSVTSNFSAPVAGIASRPAGFGNVVRQQPLRAAATATAPTGRGNCANGARAPMGTLAVKGGC